MFRQMAKYGAALIALYIVVANATGFGSLIDKGSKGATSLTRTFQGR